jgi:glycosyltransferase involved in cell wall biosynthesis
MPYRIVEVELSEPLSDLTLAPQEDGFGLVARWHDRIVGFVMQPTRPGATFAEAELRQLIDERFAMAVLEARTEAYFVGPCDSPGTFAAPSLTVAICTKDRAQRLKRLLESIDEVRGQSRFTQLDLLVVDNAPADDATRRVACSFDGVRYIVEPRTGLNFARNAALHAASGDLLAFLDDDVVVDRRWLEGLYCVWRDWPDAGGYSGLVLPYRLDTAAQLEFEQAGGFGRGFKRLHHRAAKFSSPLHPLGAGVVGAGCNMCLDRRLVLELGGFDEGLDTGAPLPGGGDLDIFYRVMCTGRGIVYEPRYAVYHEHRETLSQLRRQYWSWGLGFMAYLVKCGRADPGLRNRQMAMMRWWFATQLLALAGATRRRRWRRAGFVAAELRGGLQGLLGEYDRSLERSRGIREQVSLSESRRNPASQQGVHGGTQ